jgi:hypothetical protein
MVRNLVQELNDMPDNPPNLWRPEVGDIVYGWVTVKDTVTVKYASSIATRTVQRLMIETPDLEMVEVQATWTMLAGLLEEHKVIVGDRIAIKRLKDPLGGKTFHRFALRVDRNGDEPSALETDPIATSARSIEGMPPAIPSNQAGLDVDPSAESPETTAAAVAGAGDDDIPF